MDEIMRTAIELVVAERRRQIEKWGDQSGNHPFEWMSILGEEFGELCEAVNETCFQTQHVKPELGGTNAILREAVQVSAVALAIAETTIKNESAVVRESDCHLDIEIAFLRAEVNDHHKAVKELPVERDAACADVARQAKMIDHLSATVDRLAEELQVAVEDLKHTPGITPCWCCKHYKGRGKPSDPCSAYTQTCFDWRGPQEANDGKQDHQGIHLYQREH